MSLAKKVAFDPTLAEAVRTGLGARPKTLPPWLFYDEEGSRLFEAITELPEYYPTRTERAILETFATEIMAAAGHPGCVIELGSGSARKTALLLEAVFTHRPEVVFHPIDVSAAALDEAKTQLGERLPNLRVEPVCGHYLPALEALAHAGGPRLILFMGSTLGNFEPGEAIAFLRELRSHLRPDDLFLLGLDLEKDPAILVPAYDDAAGVTAAFNLNLLARLNRELGADFDLDAFRHLALWNAVEHRIEMHLVSLKPQTVRFAATGLEITFIEGERIHTENSYKHPPAEVDRILAEGGFAPVAAWTDARGWFTLRLARPR
ncbi:MAG: L-histidine N(alpha)-methyltransferase [Holophagaceae bacterium]|nr:L-histidine N(alpha)-methyltransferase [Holophagaceae bacterium]